MQRGEHTGAGLAVAVFLAATVEFIEAVAIMLAIGVSRSWRLPAPSGAALVAVTLTTLLVGSPVNRRR